MSSKRCTVTVDRDDLDIMVVQFSSYDDTVLAKLGKHSKEVTWRVQAGHDCVPISIKLHVDKSAVSTAQVFVMSDNEMVFPANGTGKSKLSEDFIYRWPFRGRPQGINLKDFFIMRTSTGPERWHPATITNQRDDGLFEVIAMMPDGHVGLKEVIHPAVPMQDIREAASKMPLNRPERHITLEVPCEDPLHATLSVDGADLHGPGAITRFFARPSPYLKTGEEAPRIAIDVNRERTKVTASVGHDLLMHFMTGEVRAIRAHGHKSMHSWTIQLGPYAVHTIEIEKRHTGKIVTLSVDGESFVEASAEDLGCVLSKWECNFRFVGSRCIDINVFETTRNGKCLDSKTTVVNKCTYTHECNVALPDEKDMRSAVFSVDGLSFRELPPKAAPFKEGRLETDLVTLRARYGLVIPEKVKESDLVTLRARDGLVTPEKVKKSGVAALKALDGLVMPEKVKEQNVDILMTEDGHAAHSQWKGPCYGFCCWNDSSNRKRGGATTEQSPPAPRAIASRDRH